jgi:hypothetical protein
VWLDVEISSSTQCSAGYKYKYTCVHKVQIYNWCVKPKSNQKSKIANQNIKSQIKIEILNFKLKLKIRKLKIRN